MKTTITQRTTLVALTLTMLLALDLSTASADTVVEPSPLGQMASGLNPANWKMPEWKMPSFQQMLPSQDEKARITKKKDGLFSEVGKTASNSWKKTKQALNPQKLNPVRFFQASSRTNVAPKPKSTKPGFFSSLFSPRQEEPQSTTVSDFLQQSRPNRN